MDTLNARLVIAIDGEQVNAKEFRDSIRATTIYRIETDQLRTALERGWLNVAVTVEPLDADDKRMTEQREKRSNDA